MPLSKSTRARRAQSAVARTLPRGTEIRIHLTTESGDRVPAVGIVVRGTHAPREVTVMVCAGPNWSIGAYYDRPVGEVERLGGAS
jgi:hypothetical protein